MKKIVILFLFVCNIWGQSKLLINMDLTQTNHLKAYGITFNYIKEGNIADWLLNYKGG